MGGHVIEIDSLKQYKRGLSEGRTEGRAEGRTEGKAEIAVSIVCSFMKAQNCSFEKACQMLNIDDGLIPIIREYINRN